jgi:methionyl aminopeptidase
MNSEAKESTIEAGRIAVESVKYARSIVKKGARLLDLARAIEEKIVELGGKPAFPVNLSINEIAAHATPNYDNKDIAHGLLKVDLGVHINGYTADTAFSLDLEDSELNKKLIKSAEAGLSAAMKIVRKGVSLGEIGEVIEKEIKQHDCVSVRNLTGHSIEHYELHGEVAIPNYANDSKEKLGDGVFAFEPFTTSGSGSVREGRPSGIYQLIKSGNVRSDLAREVFEFIVEQYDGLPFCSRWIHDKFGAKGLFALREIEKSEALHHYFQLVEISGAPVAQAEHTVIIDKDIVIVT